jgi:hypothetical protein
MTRADVAGKRIINTSLEYDRILSPQELWDCGIDFGVDSASSLPFWWRQAATQDSETQWFVTFHDMQACASSFVWENILEPPKPRAIMICDSEGRGQFEYVNECRVWTKADCLVLDRYYLDPIGLYATRVMRPESTIFGRRRHILQNRDALCCAPEHAKLREASKRMISAWVEMLQCIPDAAEIRELLKRQL